MPVGETGVSKRQRQKVWQGHCPVCTKEDGEARPDGPCDRTGFTVVRREGLAP